MYMYPDLAIEIKFSSTKYNGEFHGCIEMLYIDLFEFIISSVSIQQDSTLHVTCKCTYRP